MAWAFFTDDELSVIEPVNFYVGGDEDKTYISKINAILNLRWTTEKGGIVGGMHARLSANGTATDFPLWFIVHDDRPRRSETVIVQNAAVERVRVDFMIANADLRPSYKFPPGNYTLQIILNGEDGSNLKTIELHFTLTPDDSKYIRAGQGIYCSWSGTEYVCGRSLHSVTMPKGK